VDRLRKTTKNIFRNVFIQCKFEMKLPKDKSEILSLEKLA
jgi:hypothetical protein